MNKKNKFQYFDDMGTYTYQIPVWFTKACLDGVVFVRDGKTFVKNNNGEQLIKDGDFITQDAETGIYPCGD